MKNIFDWMWQFDIHFAFLFFLIVVLYVLHLIHLKKNARYIIVYIVLVPAYFMIYDGRDAALMLIVHVGVLIYWNYMERMNKRSNKVPYVISVFAINSLQFLYMIYRYYPHYVLDFISLNGSAIGFGVLLIFIVRTYFGKDYKNFTSHEFFEYFTICFYMAFLFVFFSHFFIMGNIERIPCRWKFSFMLLFCLLCASAIFSFVWQYRYWKIKRKLHNYQTYKPNVEKLIDDVRMYQHDYKNYVQTIIALSTTCQDLEEFQTEVRKVSRIP